MKTIQPSIHTHTLTAGLPALLALLLAVVALLAARPAAAEVSPSAGGSGHVTVGGEQRTLAFSAILAGNGTVRGAAQLNSRYTDTTVHLAIDCLKVVGNIAIVGGVVTHSSDPELEGRTAGFAVQDNGEGPGAPPDLITLMDILPPDSDITCMDFSPAFFGPYFMPVEHGNVQVTR